MLHDGTEAVGATPAQDTSLLYAGEMFDFDNQHYYNRARWYNPYNGLFNRTDPYAGNTQDPQSLHKYLYCHNNPINATDPTGEFFSSPYHGRIVHAKIGEHFRRSSLNDRLFNRRISTILGCKSTWWFLDRPDWWFLDRPDLVDITTTEVWEIKPLGWSVAGYAQLGWYLTLLNVNDPFGRLWKPGVTYTPPPIIEIDPMSYAFVFPPKFGLIEYEVIEFRVITAAIAAYTIDRLITEIKLITLRTALCGI